jgi:hypothetical protein
MILLNQRRLDYVWNLLDGFLLPLLVGCPLPLGDLIKGTPFRFHLQPSFDGAGWLPMPVHPARRRRTGLPKSRSRRYGGCPCRNMDQFRAMQAAPNRGG